MRFELQSDGALLQGEDFGHGPSVVLPHAGGERREVWNPVVETLVAQGYRCVTLDQRGHGASGGTRDDLFELFVRDGERLSERLARPSVLVGASLGGLVSLQLAARETSEASIAALVLVDVVPDPDPVRAREEIERGMGTAAARSALVQDILGRSEELRDAARRLTQPVLLVRAARSVALADETGHRFRQLVPHAQVTVIEDCGHLIARERPAELSAVLLDFLAQPDVQARIPSPAATTRFDHGLALLKECAADRVPHLAGTLLEHLRRTELWLDRWDAPEHVRLAGLWHAAYGTDGFDTVLLSDRARLAGILGTRAEALVYRYGACDRSSLYPQLPASSWTLRDRFTGDESELSGDELSDFALLTLANELDVARHGALDRGLRDQITDLVRTLATHRPREAQQALRALATASPHDHVHEK
jgi:pimeloyl-ACP methyl ester carboxylesterase